MSSFLVATLAIFAHPAPFGIRPSMKKRSTRVLAKLWIATTLQHTWTQYTVSRYQPLLREGSSASFQEDQGTLAARAGILPREVDIAELQAALRGLGTKVRPSELTG